MNSGLNCSWKSGGHKAPTGYHFRRGVGGKIPLSDCPLRGEPEVVLLFHMIQKSFWLPTGKGNSPGLALSWGK